jgi:hypothetical protein
MRVIIKYDFVSKEHILILFQRKVENSDVIGTSCPDWDALWFSLVPQANAGIVC